MGTHDLELRIEVKGEEEETGPSSGRMARREGLEGIVDFVLVSCANSAIIHERRETNTGDGALLDRRLADCVKMGPQASNEPFDEDLGCSEYRDELDVVGYFYLEDRGCNETFENAEAGSKEVV